MTLTAQDYIDKEDKYVAHNYKPIPVVLTKGKGTRLWDADGKEYLDFLSAYSAVSGGHANPRIIKAMMDQVQTLDVPARAYHTDKLGLFAEKLCQVTKMDKMLPMNTGAEAVETAIKAARRWGYQIKGIPANKAKIIVNHGNFHGRTTTVISFSSEPSYKKDFGPFTPGFIEIPFGDVKALEQAIDEDVCAFLTEPVQGEAGIIVPENGWLKKVKAICEKHNVLLILDEVQSGMGRTGKDFAYQHEIDPPDGLILGKALGGGVYPVSAFLGQEHVMQVFNPGSHGSTFGGNPIACAIGYEILSLMKDENWSKNSAELGAYMIEEIRKISSSLIKDVRGVGLWIGVDFHPEKVSARDVCERLMRAGLLSKETHETVVRFAPPLTMPKSEIDEGLSIFKKVLASYE